MSVLWKNIGVFFRVKKFMFLQEKELCFQHQYQWNRGRYFTWRTFICPMAMFYMRVTGVTGPGLAPSSL